MTASRQIALSLMLSLALPGYALAAVGNNAPVTPLQIAQSLPPLNPGQNTGYPTNNYSTPNYTNTYNNPYSNSGSYQQYGQQQPYNTQQAPLQGYVVTAPPGTVVAATLSSPISSEYARVGDRFTATLGSAIASGNNVILPAGSQMEGQIVMAKAAGRAGKNGELDIRFTSAMLPNGQRIPISARIQTEDGTGILKGGSTAGRLGRAAVTTGVGAGLGAALGTAMGPMSGGEVGRGAIYGTVLGAGMGALGSAMQKGKPAVLESGEPINIVLDQPLTTSPTAPSSSAYQAPPADQQNFQYYQPPQQQPQNPQPSNYNYYGN